MNVDSTVNGLRNIVESIVLDDTASLSAARRRAAALATPAVGDAVAADVALVASELMTNALEHGSPPATVKFAVSDGAFIMTVSSGTGSPGEAAGSVGAATPPAAAVHGGRGLLISAQLSSDFSLETRNGVTLATATFRRAVTAPATSPCREDPTEP